MREKRLAPRLASEPYLAVHNTCEWAARGGSFWFECII